MKMHFISGLPRSGSTLLASILNQNPRFHASIMSPVGQVVCDMLYAMGAGNEARAFFTEKRRTHMLRGAIEGFYEGCYPQVVFDNNRRWTANAAVLGRLYPECTILCCVRSPVAIVDSFERLFQRNALQPSTIHGGQPNLTVYDRVAELMKSGGVVGFAVQALRSAIFGPENRRIVLIEYDDLARFPGKVIEDVYKLLDEDLFEHNFDAIQPIAGAAEFDAGLNTPGLHDLKPKVVYEPRKILLPPEIVSSLPPPFWRVNEVETPAG